MTIVKVDLKGPLLPNDRDITQITKKNYTIYNQNTTKQAHTSILEGITATKTASNNSKIICYADLTKAEKNATFKINKLEEFSKKTIKLHVELKNEKQTLTITRNGETHTFIVPGYKNEGKKKSVDDSGPNSNVVLLEFLLDKTKGIALKTKHSKEGAVVDKSKKLLIDQKDIVKAFTEANSFEKSKTDNGYLFLQNQAKQKAQIDNEQFLIDLGYTTQKIAGDGNCFFTAMARIFSTELKLKVSSNSDESYATAFKTWLRNKIAEEFEKNETSLLKTHLDHAVVQVKALTNDPDPAVKNTTTDKDAQESILNYIVPDGPVNWNQDIGDIVNALVMPFTAFFGHKPVYLLEEIHVEYSVKEISVDVLGVKKEEEELFNKRNPKLKNDAKALKNNLLEREHASTILFKKPNHYDLLVRNSTVVSNAS